jgi:hypothetical protein
MNKEYIVPHFKNLSALQPIESVIHEIAQCLPNYESIDCINWQVFPYKPTVEFIMALLGDGIFVQFKVTENHCLGRFTNDKEPVYKDSCVELFIDPANDGTYYNFEFNCMGTLLLGYGASRHNREQASDNVFKEVKRKSTLGREPLNIEQNTNWGLGVVIPFSAFFKHQTNLFTNNSFRCNLHKCGDETSIPHYVTWNPIKTERPDFHRPEYFGNAVIKAS